MRIQYLNQIFIKGQNYEQKNIPSKTEKRRTANNRQ